MNERKSAPLYGIGGVTLLTVLLILCLTLFAVLALSAAQADLRLSEKNAGSVQSFYSAESQAYAMMERAEGIWPLGAGRPSESAFALGLEAGFPVEAEALGDGMLISAEIPVQEGRTLQVCMLLGPGAGGARWKVMKWQLLPLMQDEGDIDSLPVFQLPGD